MRYFAICTLLIIFNLGLPPGFSAAAQDRLLTYEEISEKFRTMPKDEANAWFDSLSQEQQDVFEAEMRRRAAQMEKDLEVARSNQAGLEGALAVKEGRYQDAIPMLTEAIERGTKKGLDRALLLHARGKAYEKTGRPEQALADLDEALRLGPKYAGVIYAARAPAYADLQRYDDALADFNRAIARRPDIVETYFDRGVLLFDLGRHEEALQDLNHATAQQPRNAFAWWVKGKALTALGRYDQAVNAYSKSIDAQGDVSFVWTDRGRAYVGLRQLEAARSDFSTAISLDGESWLAFEQRARVNFDLGDSDAAFTDVERSMELAPQEAGPVLARGLFFRLTGDHERAVIDFDRVIELAADIPAAYYERGNSYSQLGQLDAAIDDYAKAIELYPQYADAYFERGKAYAAQGQVDFAFGDYSKVIELNPGFAAAYVERAFIHVDDAAYDLANADLNEAIKHDPGNGDNYVYRAFTLNELGMPDEALADLDRAEGSFARGPFAETERALALFLKGENDRALSILNNVLESAPERVRALRVRGDVYQHGFKDNENALNDYHRALAISPSNAQTLFSLSVLELNKGAWSAAADTLKQLVAVAPWHDAAFNNLAYIQCCAPDPTVRDGESALANAQQAVAIQNYAAYFDTLGAAYAELGDFDKAIENTEIARDAFLAAGEGDLLKEVEAHLELYRARRPYRAAEGGT
ncbi:MAG: tetratricopeptide repeat protein [Alphaproteobacteria bacterium]